MRSMPCVPALRASVATRADSAREKAAARPLSRGMDTGCEAPTLAVHGAPGGDFAASIRGSAALSK